MKFTGILLYILLAFSLDYNLKKEVPDISTNVEERSLVASPNPANNYLDVRISQSLVGIKDTTKKLLSIQVQVLNQKGILVYSSTKNRNQFSIFTGGLPEGNYNISCKIDTMLLQQNFVVKHS